VTRGNVFPGETKSKAICTERAFDSTFATIQVERTDQRLYSAFRVNENSWLPELREELPPTKGKIEARSDLISSNAGLGGIMF